jgi:sugar fermentation stimulation protein A
VRGRLLRRYKRFLADIELDDGATIMASCPNTGAMTGLCDPGSIVWLSVSDSPKRKYAHTWQLVEVAARKPTLVGINSSLPNRIVEEAIREGLIPELAGYSRVRREVRYGSASRVDFVLEQDGRPACYVEVKNVHLSRRRGLAEFPDSVTARGAKHLAELAAMVRGGARSVMLFIIQRDDVKRFALASDIDPGYAAAFAAATAQGVEAIAYCCRLSPDTISVDCRLPIAWPP